MKKNIFISHSSVNKEIAEQLCSFMVRLGIKEEGIFCSSIIGQGVNNGEKLNEAIGKAISKSTLLVYILSRDFLESSYCMEELGVGWYLSQQKKASCFYLIVPDVDLSDLKGFVNSKIDKFTFIDENHKDELGLFAENICKVLKIKLPKHSAMANIESTFFSATKSLISATVERSGKLQQEREEKAKKVETLETEIERLMKYIDSTCEERNKENKKIEYRTICNHFQHLGFGGGITKKEFKTFNKNFWFDMVNKFEELEMETTCYNDSMEMLLATIYSANGNHKEACKRLKNYIYCHWGLIYPHELENVEITSIDDLQEMIELLQTKIAKTSQGLAYDSYQETLEYLFDLKAKMEGKQ